MLSVWVEPIPKAKPNQEEQRSWLRKHLAITLNCPQESLEFNYNPHGKPYLAHHPEWHFNLSHSRTFRVLAVSSQPVGIDVERQRQMNYAAIIPRFFHPDEQVYFNTIPEDELAERFIQHWTCKEALLKQLGTGIANHLSRYPILYNGTQAYCPDFPELKFYQIQLTPTDYMCVASPEKCLEYGDGDGIMVLEN